jgi:hypothetical protein
LEQEDEFPLTYPLKDVVEKWTYASVNVDDRRSAWTTFAMLYAMFLSGGKDGSFYSSLSEKTAQTLDKFIMQIDMQFLYDASKNYQVAAGIINALRLKFGYISETECPPEDNIKVMLDAYLGDGFFNDDDTRGSGQDRRIDGYSAEIIGLLLHYDEIYEWQSPWHDRIAEILKDFCASNLRMIDSNGEYAKWGRSLRGEAEAKKLFIWEYAEKNNLVKTPGDGASASQAQMNFFLKNGIAPDGQVFRDKGGNKGIWDEYTTHVQAQGYGAYGLAMALHFASGKEAEKPLPSKTDSYVRFLEGPQIICANDNSSGVHYVVPLANRLTKLMFLWHNRITGENDVSVDMSPKFMPIPYFGKTLPAPYAAPEIPFLPLLLDSKKELLVPRNLGLAIQVDVKDNLIRCIQRFAYCRAAQFEKASPLELVSKLEASSKALEYSFEFVSDETDKIQAMIYFYNGGGELKVNGNSASVEKDALQLKYSIEGVTAEWQEVICGPSIYSEKTSAACASFQICGGLKMNYKFTWEKK